ncbi:MAG: S-adenosyl-L-methionine--L-histidine 3-amino-3-carboxypropyltransferase [Candidatus Nitrosocaldaceae archaeon]|nr:MAG: S-adenosyl-L-methionine--L-histidine 3-amino-3-carboxypropyltransferase [Candidatus Nitrosocaldaceae archaeon]
MIKIDEEYIFRVIDERQPKRVALNGPEGLIKHIQEIADKINEDGIEAYVIGDTCYGSCDINYHAAEMLNADILFHIGHTISIDEMNYGKVVMIPAYDDIKFDHVIEKCIDMLDYDKVGVVTDSQHLHELDNAIDALSKKFKVIRGKGKGQLNDGQVFGCEFYPVYDIKDEIEAYLFLGQSMFHAAGVAIATNKPTYMLDPYFNEVKEVNSFAEQLKKRSILSIYKALDARKIGIVVGLKEGQLMINRVKDIKAKLEKHKEVSLIALTDVTEDRLQLFDADAFIQIACPRISTDNPFKKPVLSVPQAYALIDLLEGKKLDIDRILGISHWL